MRTRGAWLSPERRGADRVVERPPALPDAARAPFPRVFFATQDRSGPLIWRCLWPAAALVRQGYYVAHGRLQNPRSAQNAVGTDAIVFNRMSWLGTELPQGEAFIAEQHRQGRVLLFEMDDDLISIDCREQLHLLGAQEGLSPGEVDDAILRRLESIHRLDGVTVTTEHLAGVVRGLTDTPVAVVPNAIDWAWFQDVSLGAPRQDRRLTIGWAGGRRLEADTAPLAEAWRRVARRYPHVAFKVAGYQAPDLLAAVPEAQRIAARWEPLDRYARAYAGIDIGCCPLADTPFNRCKTPVKAYEYAAMDAAVVASPTVYAAALGPDKFGLLADTADAWEDALCRLIEDQALRFTLAARWAKRVRERHSLPGQAGAWPRAWANLIGAARARLGLRRGPPLVAHGMYRG